MAFYNRVCKTCGVMFLGGSSAQYCPECKIERKKEQKRKYNSQGYQRSIGSIDRCENCGNEYIVNSGKQKYCHDCRDEVRKRINNELSTKYYHEKVDKKERKIKRRIYWAKNKEKMNEKKRKYYAANKEKIRKRENEYFKKNPDKYRFFLDVNSAKQRLKRYDWDKSKKKENDENKK